MFVILMTFLGAAVGSFLTVAVERFERGETFARNRSYCDSCKKQLRWWELVPLLSYVFLRGKCIRCDARIPAFSFWFEVIAGAIFGLMAAMNPLGMSDPLFYAQLVVVSSLLLLFFYDLRYQVFPGLYLLISAVVVLCYVVLRSVLGGESERIVTETFGFTWLSSPESPWAMYLLGGTVGGGLLGLLAYPSRGTWMGYGDVLLGAILGLWVGYPLITVSLLLAFYLGALIGIGLLLAKRVGQDHRIAFGPFLILGAFLTHIWGERLFRAIIQLWGG